MWLCGVVSARVNKRQNASDIEQTLGDSNEIDRYISVQVENNSYVIESYTQLVEEDISHVSQLVSVGDSVS